MFLDKKGKLIYLFQWHGSKLYVQGTLDDLCLILTVMGTQHQLAVERADFGMRTFRFASARLVSVQQLEISFT